MLHRSERVSRGWKERYKIRLSWRWGRLAPKPPCEYNLRTNQFLQINLLWVAVAYYGIVTRDSLSLSVCIRFSVLLVAMVLSPHAVPVVSSLWIRGWRDAAPQRARFRFLGRWSPPVVRGEGGSALSLDVQEVQEQQQQHCHNPGTGKHPKLERRRR